MSCNDALSVSQRVFFFSKYRTDTQLYSTVSTVQVQNKISYSPCRMRMCGPILRLLHTSIIGLRVGFGHVLT